MTLAGGHMAHFGLRGLRRLQLLPSPAPCTLRKAQIFKLPESKPEAWRFLYVRSFGEIAALEDISNTAPNTKNSSGGVDARSPEEYFLLKRDDGSRNNGLSVKDPHLDEDLNSVVAAGKSSSQRDTEKLTEFIIESFRNEKQKPNCSPKNRRIDIPLNSLGGTSKKSDDEKIDWQQVIRSIGRTGESPPADDARSSSSAGESDADEEDDFADLDFPQEAEKAGVVTSSNTASRSSLSSRPKSAEVQLLTETFKKEGSSSTVPAKTSPISNGASRGNQFQNWNQQKAKESKAISLDFLTSTHTSGTSATGERPDNSIFRRDTLSSSLKDDEAAVFSTVDSGFTVCVQNLPARCSLVQIKEALSYYGEVTGSFKRPGPNGLCGCYIEFKTDEAKEDALAARWLHVEGKQFSIIRVDRPMTTVVRIRNVSSETTESKILFTCERCGKVDNIKRREKGVFDVYYRPRELSSMPRILNSLNEVTLNHSRWTAQPAPLIHPEAKKDLLKTREGKAWHLSQMSQVLNRMEVGLDKVAVAFQDLKVLSSMEESVTGSSEQ